MAEINSIPNTARHSAVVLTCALLLLFPTPGPLVAGTVDEPSVDGEANCEENFSLLFASEPDRELLAMREELEIIEKYLGLCASKRLKNLLRNPEAALGYDYRSFVDTLVNGRTKSLWISNGGHGCIEFYEQLEDDIASGKINISAPKTLVGFSDFTHLSSLLSEIPNLRIFYGPSFLEFMNYHRNSRTAGVGRSGYPDRLDLIGNVFFADIHFSSKLRAFFNDSKKTKIVFSRVTGGLLTIFLGHNKLETTVRRKILNSNDGHLLIDLGVQKNLDSVDNQFRSLLKSFSTSELRLFRRITLNYRIISRFRLADEHGYLKLQLHKILDKLPNRDRIVLDIHGGKALDPGKYSGKTIVYPHNLTVLELDVRDSILVFEDVGYDQAYLNTISQKLISTVNGMDIENRPKAIVFGSILPLDTMTPGKRRRFHRKFLNMLRHISNRTGIAVYRLDSKNISHDSDSVFIPLGGGLVGTIENRTLEIKDTE
ncbi:MAG: LD-carboxypeptidase [Rickettsiales bacterium]|nr:LD-carboxypeptidase [Rickettsiales bacterium]